MSASTLGRLSGHQHDDGAGLAGEYADDNDEDDVAGIEEEYDDASGSQRTTLASFDSWVVNSSH